MLSVSALSVRLNRRGPMAVAEQGHVPSHLKSAKGACSLALVWEDFLCEYSVSEPAMLLSERPEQLTPSKPSY